jgi:TonB family protein
MLQDARRRNLPMRLVRICARGRVIAVVLPLAAWSPGPAASDAAAQAAATDPAPATATVPPAAPPDQAEAPPSDPPAPLALMPLSTVAPDIPDEVCRQRLSGWVELEYAVLPDGKVSNLKVVSSEPAGAFESAAVGAVAQWTYPPQDQPVVLHQTLPLSFADCRLEQLRADAADPDAAPATPDECAAIAAAAHEAGERFAPADAARAVLRGEPAQAYSAPDARCALAGRTLAPGTRLTAHLEHERYTLVSRGKGGDESKAVWVRSGQLKDLAP